MKSSPKYILILLCLVNYLNYIDRFILAALLSAIKTDLSLSDLQAGALATAFMLPYVFVAPLWGWLGDVKPRHSLLAFGATLWSVSTFATGFAKNFLGVLGARFGLGVGESAFTTIAPAFIADFFSPQKQGRMLAIFSTALPVGAALGYILGGILGHHWGWRTAFFIVGFPGLLLAFLIFRIHDPRPKNSYSLHPSSSWLRNFKILVGQREYLVVVLGYCAYTYVLGGLAHWMPTVLERFYGLDPLKANLYFGGVAVISGLSGTLCGGFFSDHLEKKMGNGYLRLSAYSMLLALPFLFFTWSARSLPWFLGFLFITEFLLFISTSPINVIIISRVPQHLRSSAMALAILACHILGDAISSPLIGWVSDVTGDLLLGVLSTLPVALICGALWLYASLKFWRPRPWPTEGMTLPILQAHRGHWWQGPQENTLDAFARAKDLGYQMCELDVQLSRDGIPVVFHDSDLKRLGKDGRKVSELTAHQLESAAQIPTLEKVLQQNSLGFNIEIKSKESKDFGLEKAVGAVVRKCASEKRIIFSSFNPIALRRLSFLLPQVPLALLVSAEKTAENKIYLRRMWLAGFSRAHMLNLDQALLTEKRMQSLALRNVPVGAWTVNDPKQAQFFLKSGVKTIISDQILPEDLKNGVL